jgi:glycosyltransferase involved in cell wall biosynthesis
MKLSVIVCTYRRPEPLALLLQSLASQTWKSFEVLLVDGAGEEGVAQTRLMASAHAPQVDLRVLSSPKGLTKQRNTGLKAAIGDIVCFLDDDVTFDADFLSKTAALFESREMAGIGGLTAYDAINYPQQVNSRWRLRRALRIIPSLRPGDISRLGASVPVSFFPRFSGLRPVGFFYGFCMIFRRAAIDGLWFDQDLPTYGGEDRDFSFRVSREWPLMLCGDLEIRHFRSAQSRDSLVQRTYQTGYGVGRTFAKHYTSALDFVSLAWSILCEFLIDGLAFFQRPSVDKCRMPFARVAGTFAGVCSKPSGDTRDISRTRTAYRTRTAD